ncbi:relaxase/mobilization nuclease domain-containing protein [Dysgonomonas sp. HDW5B]|uniref:relaxase/mobilization nuclease domain-containing protein n=1 Tax=Dysgonomonas sp. HDW5B TaxID=2714927 RepID=UPI00140CBF9C|nr:relaxase/mobilization nuclease domain-containing protein [Dysgonomonas sp. HDW5B]QIK55712.1 relaxase/mobilization nuclease domain-containing protein [Dysgonomonas sp. HDW5B]
MIGKITKGRSFKGCISYVMDKPKAELIGYSDGILLSDTKSIINSFYLQSLMNPNLSKSVGHISLSYSKEDDLRLTNPFMLQLAKEYLQKMNIKDTQYIIVRHKDAEHPHCHIVFNRVNNEGKTISDKNDQYRNEKVCKAIKDSYQLTYGKGKENTNIHMLRGTEKTKHEVYAVVNKALSISKDWQQFEIILRQKGVSVQYKCKGQTNEVQGISFGKDGVSFKGSEIDRRFSYSKLVQQITQNGKQAQQPNTRNMESKSVVESVLDGLSGTGLLQTHGDDYQEEAFRNRMEYEESKRQRKKKRKGFGL